MMLKKLIYIGLLGIWTNILLAVQGELVDVNWVTIPEMNHSILKKYFPLQIGEKVDSIKIQEALKSFVQRLQKSDYPIAKIDSAVWKSVQYGGILEIYLSNLYPLKLDSVKVEGDTSLTFQNVTNQLFPKNQFETIILNWYENKVLQSQPLAYATIDSGAIVQQNQELSVKFNVYADTVCTVSLSDLMIPNGNRIKQEYWRRETRISFPSVFSLKKVNKAKKYLQATELFSELEDYELVKYGSDYFLYFPNQMLPPTRIDGIVGYIPPIRNQKGVVIGTIELSFYQLFQSFRKLYFKWSKPNRGDQSFVLSYREPWLLNFPLSGIVELKSSIRDTLYSEFQTSIYLDWRVNELWEIRSGISLREVTIDSLYRIASGLDNTIGNEYHFRVTYDTRDYLENPRKGLKLQTEWRYAFHSITKAERKNYQVQKIEYKLEQFTPLGRYNSIMFGLKGGEIYSRWQNLPIIEMYRIGGPEYIRGYRPDLFLAQKYGIFTCEPRWILQSRTRTYLFTDIGYLIYPKNSVKSHELIYGNGFGMLIGFKANSVGVVFGWSKLDALLDGKITFQINQRF